MLTTRVGKPKCVSHTDDFIWCEFKLHTQVFHWKSPFRFPKAPKHPSIRTFTKGILNINGPCWSDFFMKKSLHKTFSSAFFRLEKYLHYNTCEKTSENRKIWFFVPMPLSRWENSLFMNKISDKLGNYFPLTGFSFLQKLLILKIFLMLNWAIDLLFAPSKFLRNIFLVGVTWQMSTSLMCWAM